MPNRKFFGIPIGVKTEPNEEAADMGEGAEVVGEGLDPIGSLRPSLRSTSKLRR